MRTLTYNTRYSLPTDKGFNVCDVREDMYVCMINIGKFTLLVRSTVYQLPNNINLNPSFKADISFLL